MFIDISKITLANGKTYTRALLRTAFRDENGKVKHKTMGNLSHCSLQEIEAIRFALKNKHHLPEILANGASPEYSSRQGLSVGAVYTLSQIAQRLGITDALGTNRQGKLALWQVIARIIDQGSRLSATRLATSHAACDCLGINAPFNEDDLYENLDWLSENQTRIEQRLFKHRYPIERPSLFLYDVTSSYLEGQYNALAAFGYNRDGKKGKKQIVVGLLCDQQGVPLSIEVFKGNTADVSTMPEQIQKVAQRFGSTEVTFVGDRGMIKSSVIDTLKDHEGFHYITALTKPQIETLLKKETIQLSLFDDNLVEVNDSELSIRYVLRRNPIRMEEIAQSRRAKQLTVERLIEQKNSYLQQHTKAKVSTAQNHVRMKIKQLGLDAWLSVEYADRVLSLCVSQEALAEESKLDGCYVIKTDLMARSIDAATVHDRYKDLAKVESAFRTSKTFELEMRPINVRKEARTRGHVFVVMLAYIIVKELSRLWAKVDLKVEEAINELASLCLTEMCSNGVALCNTIPFPRPSVQRLLEAANVTLPPVLPASGVVVATKKKLTENRKTQ